ncbi:PIG-L deacetylase family protein [Agromyces aerolatus]|uniref:PIG-L deacetylase family protein n=1 Tax=Agromyces sp. LY-1074 TaxID=3074080 RepID=UPI00285E30FF|nr:MULTISPECIES: hypothetical protein [unclassified Agromyces]MDR5700852.1 hypothetical protein [Agromyces sp. LY-1074]MDR5707487.1 hypothetical protein [Agromyces sp. LY-1358]
MQVLAVGADAAGLVIAAGGTLRMWADAGNDVHAVLVRDVSSPPEDTRRAREAFAGLDVRLHDAVELERIADERAARDALMDVIRGVSPDVILAPSGNSIHAKERELSRLVFGAAYCACVPNYPSPSGVSAASVRAMILHTDPTLGFASGTPEYVDIDSAWAAKRAAIKCFEEAEAHLVAAEALSGARGVQVQRERAEAFGMEPAWGRLRPYRVLP